MIAIEQTLLAAGLLLLLGILASQISGRLGLPALVLFLLIGILAGSEGIGGIEFDNYELAQTLGIVALAFILFAGGLDTRWLDVKPILWRGVGLSTLAVLLTAVCTGLFAAWVLNLSILEALLLGAIVSSTDAAAVFAVMRSRNVSLQDRLKRTLEFESGSNDPMAVFLTVGLITLILQPGASILTLVPMFLQQMALGGLIGFGLGWTMVQVINRARLGYDGLYSVLTLASVLLVYGASATLGGNGFLAVYVAGLVMGNHDFVHKRSLMRFHDGLAWLLQMAMFIALGLLVFPSELLPVAWAGLALSLFLIFIARPIGVFVTLWPARLSWRETTVISWVGLRGAVPIILATYPLVAGVAHADTIFNVIFFIVLTSVLLQGPSIPLVARWLKVDAPLKERPRYPLEFEQTTKMDSDLVEVAVPSRSPAAGRQILDLHLPDEALIVLISRKDAFIVPRGTTVLEPNDRLLLLADKPSLERVQAIVRGGKEAERA